MIIEVLAGDNAPTAQRLRAQHDLFELVKWHCPMAQPRPGIRRSTITHSAQDLADKSGEILDRLEDAWTKLDVIERWMGEYHHVLFPPLDSSVAARRASALRHYIHEQRRPQMLAIGALLSALRDYCGVILERVGTDVGKQEDLLSEMTGGNPKRKLAADAALLYIAYRDDISSTLHGRFHTFYDELVQLLTGKNPTDKTQGTYRQIKTAALIGKKIVAIKREFRERGEVAGPPYRGSDPRLLELDKQLTSLHRELVPPLAVLPSRPKALRTRQSRRGLTKRGKS